MALRVVISAPERPADGLRSGNETAQYALVRRNRRAGAPMEVVSTAIPDVKIITPKKFGDHRGFFSEVFRLDVFSAFGIGCQFVQDNHSLSASAGVVRGLHWQVGAAAQHKLVRVLKGAI